MLKYLSIFTSIFSPFQEITEFKFNTNNKENNAANITINFNINRKNFCFMSKIPQRKSASAPKIAMNVNGTASLLAAEDAMHVISEYRAIITHMNSKDLMKFLKVEKAVVI